MLKDNSTEMYDIQLETMSLETRRKHYDKKVRWVIDYAYENAPAIRDKFYKAGIKPSQIQSVKDLEKVPVTNKEELIELQKSNPPLGGLLAVPVEKVWKFFVSTGPIYDAIGNSEDFWEMQKKIFHNVGFRKGDVVLITFSYHLVPAAWDADEALRQLGITVIPGGVGSSEDQMEIALRLGVTGYIGTPSFLMTLIKKAEDKGYNFRHDFKIKRAAVGGEPLSSSLRNELENNYGISVFNIFGTADIQWVGYECEYKTGMHIAEELLMEIVDPQTGKQVKAGEVGEIVVTSFDETYPLIRFGLGDLACLSDEPCPCGRTSPRLIKFAGRVRDVIRVRGRFIYPNDVRKAIENFSEVSKYQIIVSRSAYRDELTLAIESEQDDVNKNELEKLLQKSVKEHCLLKIDEIKFIAGGTIKDEKIVIDKRIWD